MHVLHRGFSHFRILDTSYIYWSKSPSYIWYGSKNKIHKNKLFQAAAVGGASPASLTRQPMIWARCSLYFYLFIWSHVQLITFYRSLGASTCYSAVSCHVSQSSCWGRRPERGIFREKSNSNTINMSHIPWGQKSWEGWAHIIYSWTWIGTISRGTPWGTLHPLSVALAVFRFVQVKLENGSHVLCA